MKESERIKNEIKLAIKKENSDLDGESFDYGIACYKSAEKAVLSMLEDEHSGYSFGVTTNIINRLLAGLPLTPITEKDFTKVDYVDGGCNCYMENTMIQTKQCPRMSSLFQETKTVFADDETKIVTISYNRVGNIITVDLLTGATYSGGRGQWFIKKHIKPITMPYWPEDDKYVIRAVSYYDFEYFIDYSTPDGSRYKLNKLIYNDCGVEIKGLKKYRIVSKIKKYIKNMGVKI